MLQEFRSRHPQESGFCADCHAPGAFVKTKRPGAVDLADPDTVDLLALDPNASNSPRTHGVQCVTCHRVEQVTTDVEALNFAGGARLDKANEPFQVHGPWDDVFQMRAIPDTVYTQSLDCATCHEYQRPAGATRPADPGPVHVHRVAALAGAPAGRVTAEGRRHLPALPHAGATDHDSAVRVLASGHPARPRVAAGAGPHVLGHDPGPRRVRQPAGRRGGAGPAGGTDGARRSGGVHPGDELDGGTSAADGYRFAQPAGAGPGLGLDGPAAGAGVGARRGAALVGGHRHGARGRGRPTREGLREVPQQKRATVRRPAEPVRRVLRGAVRGAGQPDSRARCPTPSARTSN